MILVLLLRKGGNINAKDDHGRTALHVAVKYGKVKMVQILLENRAKNWPGQSGKPALQLANESGSREIVDILRSAEQHRPA